METDAINRIVEMITQFGLGGIFLYLFLKERTEHEETRKAYREDLRDMAGLAPRFQTWQNREGKLPPITPTESPVTSGGD